MRNGSDHPIGGFLSGDWVHSRKQEMGPYDLGSRRFLRVPFSGGSKRKQKTTGEGKRVSPILTLEGSTILLEKA